MHRVLLVVTIALASCAGLSREVPADVAVTTGVDLGLTAADRLEKSFTPGVWTADREGDVVRMRMSLLVGDEGGLVRSLELDFSTDPPVVRSGSVEYYDAYDDDRIIPISGGVLELQHADPDGIIAGRWIGETDAMIRFWVDLSDHSYAEIEEDRPFVLQPGGYALWNDATVFQYRTVTEDSRCPPDVACVWEGRVAIEGHVWDIEDERVIRLRGFQTEDGPAYGTQPTERLRPGLEIALLSVDGEGLATFVVERSS